MAKVPNIVKTFLSENFYRLSRVHERYRQKDDRPTTDERTMTYSERQLYKKKMYIRSPGFLSILDLEMTWLFFYTAMAFAPDDLPHDLLTWKWPGCFDVLAPPLCDCCVG